MSFLAPNPSARPAPPSPVPAAEDPAIEVTRRKLPISARQRQGYSATIFIGGTSLAHSAPAE